jgi:putative hemolysin
LRELITSDDIIKAANISMPGGNIIGKVLMQIFGFNKINKFYSSVYSKDPASFINSVLEQLDVDFEVTEADLAKIPLTGPVITISNHPLGGIDSMILLKILLSRRPDVKIMANFILQKIDPLRDLILPVNPFETRKEVKSSFSGLKSGISYLNDSHLVSIFPAGEVSTYHPDSTVISDREWQKPAMKLIKMAKVPVIPIYFHGSNSKLFYILSRIHPMLRTASLPSEFLKKNKTIQVRIGKPISVSEQIEFSDLTVYGRFLRAKTYSLGSGIEVKSFFDQFKRRRLKKTVPVAEPIDNHKILSEIDNLRNSFEMFSSENFSVFFAPVSAIPDIIQEIGRLREITFRAVGEGTNMQRDIDEYDFYYYHLILWDNKKSKIVGSYRIGKGRDILSQYGIKGFYINSLFRIKSDFADYLSNSMELGRSFIIKEYQRKSLPLFLLWKGILMVLAKNPDYKYLIGPVSISNDFSNFSKDLIIKFIKKNYFNPELAKYIKPRNRFSIRNNGSYDTEIIANYASDDIRKIEHVLTDVDHGIKMPVLLKKYLEVNGQIIGFNIDPDFNDCLDGLITVDIYKIPAEFIKALTKESKDDSLEVRFRGR